MKEAERSSIKKILVIRLDRVGDLILSTPFFRNLRDHFPGAEITALVTPYTREVLEGNPSVTRILTFTGKKNVKSLYAFTRPVAADPPDLAIALSPVSSAYMLARLSGASRRSGYVYSRRWLTRIFAGSLLTHVKVFSIDEALHEGEPVPHEVQQTLSLLDDLGLSTVEYPLELFPGAEALAYAEKEMAPWREKKKIVGIHLSEKWLTCAWREEDLVTLARTVLGNSAESALLITYGSLEKKLGEEISRLLEDDGRIRCIGELSFRKWAALVGHCGIFITTDTGALHCAVAMKVPVLAVYEAGSFSHCSQQWAPWKCPGLVIRKETPAKTIGELKEGVEKFI
jgi:heptosyltransferase II